MRVDLVKLLAEHPIVHPTRVERVVICQNYVEMVVSGHPWWVDVSPEIVSPRIVLIFETISEGTLPVPFDNSYEEDLDDFFVQPLANVDWASSCCHEIYCHAPAPKPETIYSLLQAFLRRVHAFKQPGDFLNGAHLLADFTEIASGGSYLLARVPEVLCRLLCGELDRQAIPHNVIRGTTRTDSRLWVRLGTSSFLCAAAWAEIG